MVGKTHLLDFAAYEVPLPLFGLGYDWACTFCGAPLPPLGQARAPKFTFVRHLHPKFGFGYDWADASVNFVGVFIGR